MDFLRRTTGFRAWHLAVAAATFVVLATFGCEALGEPSGAESADPGTAAAAVSGESDAPRSEAETPTDWERFRETVGWARAQGLDTVSMGETVARIGEAFVGTPYRPHTLEIPGTERLVVNLRALDCVTFVETALALARFVRSTPPDFLERDEEAARAHYREILTELRYRGGVLDGYPSRLHYFSEWISDNQARGYVRNLTAELGGVKDTEPVEFMSTHPDAYRQLGEEPANLEAIRRIEARLSREGRTYIPQELIDEAAPGIRTGDIIAATSTVKGLDVAHTGIAVWRDGELRLMHAPLVGDSVQVSPRSLAERVRAIKGQDGIMVARPLFHMFFDAPAKEG